jgi:hypothetical protein
MVAVLIGCESGPQCPTDVPEPSPRPASSGRNRLVYALVGNAPDDPQLWMIDLDQATPTPLRIDGRGQLIRDWGSSFQGVWSPSGDRVAVRLNSGESVLGVIDLANPGVIRDVGLPIAGALPTPEHHGDVWSPESDRLVAIHPVLQEVRVANLLTGGTTVVATDLGVMDAAWFSPDGRYVGITLFPESGASEFHVTPADENAPRLVAKSTFWWGAAGSQVIGSNEEFHWQVTDVEADVRVENTITGEGNQRGPVFNSDGTWMLVPGDAPPRIRWRGCGECTQLDGAPAFARDARATADPRFIVFTGPSQFVEPDETSAWVAEHIDGRWRARHVFTPGAMAIPQVSEPVVSRTGSRAAWRFGAEGSAMFVVTRDELRDPATFRVDALRNGFPEPSHWFSGDLERFAYLMGSGSFPTLRVLDVTDPSAATLLGELTAPAGLTIGWVAWSAGGTALAFTARDRAVSTPGARIYVTRIVDGTLEAPRFLGTTLNNEWVAFQWAP